MENSPQNIRGYTDIFTVLYYRRSPMFISHVLMDMHIRWNKSWNSKIADFVCNRRCMVADLHHWALQHLVVLDEILTAVKLSSLRKNTHDAPQSPLCENMTLSTKPEKHNNISQRRQSRTEPRPQAACTKMVKFRRVVSEICERTYDRQKKETDMLFAVLHTPLGGEVITPL